ncbi:MAG: hypothetical protein AB2693_32320, partial [Candidatus Thiodiazotropha sp.]
VTKHMIFKLGYCSECPFDMFDIHTKKLLLQNVPFLPVFISERLCLLAEPKCVFVNMSKGSCSSVLF